MDASAFHSARTKSGDGKPGQASASAGLSVSAASRTTAGRLADPRAFLRARRGGVAIEAALSLAALVTVFSGLMAVAHGAYMDDRMDRAARAAARAVALVTDTAATGATLASAACTAIKRELDLADDFDCTTWTVSVKNDLMPSALSSGTNSVGETGDMVLVTIEWQQAPWVQAVQALGGSGGRIAAGVARREPADPAAGA